MSAIDLYILFHGSIEIYYQEAEEPVPIWTINAGSVVGELGVISDEYPVMGARAASDVIVGIICYEDILKLFSLSPEACITIMKQVVRNVIDFAVRFPHLMARDNPHHPDKKRQNGKDHPFSMKRGDEA